MSIKNSYTVESIPKHETHDWLLFKHYAKRIPSISYAFGLFNNGSLIGVCTFGRPIAHTLIKNAFNGKYQK